MSNDRKEMSKSNIKAVSDWVSEWVWAKEMGREKKWVIAEKWDCEKDTWRSMKREGEIERGRALLEIRRL